jgi:GNAT superfamily N-acetyltransferase
MRGAPLRGEREIMSPNFIIRPLMPSDSAFLWEMVYHAIHVPEGEPAPAHDIVYDPMIAAYVRGWGREGDVGFAAVSTGSAQRVGAAWVRLFDREMPGHGFLDETTPELSMAILPEYRGAGIGTALLERLVASLRERHDALSLSVARRNPALRLYSRAGFVEVGGDSDTAVMRLVLKRMDEEMRIL